MPKFRPRPIDAIKYDGTARSLDTIFDWSGGELDVSTDEQGRITLQTMEGDHKVSPGSYIVRDPTGGFYPHKADLFEAIYELID